MSPLRNEKTCRDSSHAFIVIKSLFIGETISQVLLSRTILTEFDLRSSSLKWFEHNRFGNLLTMTLVLVSLQIKKKLGKYS